MRRLYITDLDGTLLNRDSQLSEATRGILKALLEDGALVTIATGRSLPSLREIMGDVLPRIPVVIHNGARIADPLTGEYLYSNTMNRGMMDELIALAFAEHFAPFLNACGENGDLFCYTLPANAATEDYIQYRRTIMPDSMQMYRFRSELEQLDFINLNIIDDRGRLDAFRQMVLETFSPWVDVHITTDPNFPELGWLTIGDSRSHKAEAIRALKRMVSEDPLYVTVFGDQLNDLQMFEAADRAIAVENASPELVELADLVIGPHWEDSVARFIAQEWIEIGETDKERTGVEG